MNDLLPKDLREAIHGLASLVKVILDLTKDGFQPTEDGAALVRKLLEDGKFREALWMAFDGAGNIPEEFRNMTVDSILSEIIKATAPQALPA